MKPAIQLEREAAVVLSQGGGFQSYYNQRRDGSVPAEHLPVIGEVAAFCRARQPFCQGATPVPQIAFLYSTASHYREINGLFNRELARLTGTLQALVGSQCVVDVVGEHVLAKRMAEYPLVIVGECDYLEPDFRQQLIRYVEAGGNLLLVGPQAAAMFTEPLDVTLESPQSEPRFLAAGGGLVPTRGPTQGVVLKARAKGHGLLHRADDPASPSQPAASVASLGKGRIAAIYFPFSRSYLDARSPKLGAFVGDLVRELFPEPLVEVQGSPEVEVTANRLGSWLAVNLINVSGAHWDAKKPLIEQIAAVGPLDVAVRTPARPAKVTLQPEGRSLPFEYRDGRLHTSVPRLDVHSVLVVE